MPFNVSDCINNLTNKIIESPSIQYIFENPVFTAIVIVLVMIIVNLIVFRDVDSEESLTTMCLRGGFWMFFMVSGIMLIYTKLLDRGKQLTFGGYGSLFGDDGVYEMATVPIAIPEYE